MAIVTNVCNGNSRAANACLAVENSRIGRDVLAKGSRELDEPLSSFERRDDLGQPRVEAAQQLGATGIADPDPDDGRAAVQQLVHGEILVLRHDHCARFRSPCTNPRIRGPLQTEVSYVFSLVALRFQLARERRRELGVDEEAQSRAPQDRVVVLPGGKLQHCGDVFGFEVWVVCENLLARSAGSKEVEHVLHADAQATNARTAPADVWAYRNAVERAHGSIVARLRLVVRSPALVAERHCFAGEPVRRVADRRSNILARQPEVRIHQVAFGSPSAHLPQNQLDRNPRAADDRLLEHATNVRVRRSRLRTER